MTGESSILAYYMACLDQGPDTLDLTQVASRGEMFGGAYPKYYYVTTCGISISPACHGFLPVFISERSSDWKRWNPFVTTSATSSRYFSIETCTHRHFQFTADQILAAEAERQ